MYNIGVTYTGMLLSTAISFWGAFDYVKRDKKYFRYRPTLLKNKNTKFRQFLLRIFDSRAKKDAFYYTRIALSILFFLRWG